MKSRVYCVGKNMPSMTRGLFTKKPRTDVKVSELLDAFQMEEEKGAAVVVVFKDKIDAQAYRDKKITELKKHVTAETLPSSAPIFTIKADLSEATPATVNSDAKEPVYIIKNAHVLDKVSAEFLGKETNLQSKYVKRYDDAYNAAFSGSGFNIMAVATLQAYIEHRMSKQLPKCGLEAQALQNKLNTGVLTTNESILAALQNERLNNKVMNSKQYKDVIDVLINNLKVLMQQPPSSSSSSSSPSPTRS